MGSKESVRASGVYAALATPRRPESIEGDAVALLDYLDEIVRAGVDGLVLFGSTGEFVHFDVSERMRLLTFAVRRSRVPILVNVSHSTLAGATDLAEHALQSGADGVLLLPPYLYKYPEAQIARFYEKFLESLGRIPVYLYNLPSLTNRMSLDLAERLLASGAFAGIKDSSDDWEMFEHLSALKRKKAFQLLIGSESLYLRARLAGADGIISGAAAALPELVVALEKSVRNSDPSAAQKLDSFLQEFLAWLSRVPPALGIKQAVVARGWQHERFAVPLDEQTAAELQRFEQWFRGWLPTVLWECQAGRRNTDPRSANE